MRAMKQYMIIIQSCVFRTRYLVAARYVLTACLMVFIMAASAAAADDWVKLGDRYVSIDTDKDEIPVSLLKGKFTKIKLKAKGNNIFISNVTVIYSTGASDLIPVLGLLKEGEETRELDLRGKERSIKKIEMTFKRIPNLKGMAEIIVYGKR